MCLSENVDCIVVNDRHGADTAMRELLDEFVTKNKCNLIWMERADRIDYPSFTHVYAPALGPSFVPLALPAPTMSYAAPAAPPGISLMCSVSVCVCVFEIKKRGLGVTFVGCPQLEAICSSTWTYVPLYMYDAI